MSINHTSEIAKLNEIISDLVAQMADCLNDPKGADKYPKLYDKFETAHDRRETLLALTEADKFYVTEED